MTTRARAAVAAAIGTERLALVLVAPGPGVAESERRERCPAVAIFCSNVYAVGGTVSGLTGAGLVLQNNAGHDLAIWSNGAFTFPTRLTSDSDGSLWTWGFNPWGQLGDGGGIRKIPGCPAGGCAVRREAVRRPA